VLLAVAELLVVVCPHPTIGLEKLEIMLKTKKEKSIKLKL